MKSIDKTVSVNEKYFSPAKPSTQIRDSINSAYRDKYCGLDAYENLILLVYV
jgi:hypothetical protein